MLTRSLRCVDCWPDPGGWSGPGSSAARCGRRPSRPAGCCRGHPRVRAVAPDRAPGRREPPVRHRGAGPHAGPLVAAAPARPRTSRSAWPASRPRSEARPSSSSPRTAPRSRSSSGSTTRARPAPPSSPWTPATATPSSTRSPTRRSRSRSRCRSTPGSTWCRPRPGSDAAARASAACATAWRLLDSVSGPTATPPLRRHARRHRRHRLNPAAALVAVTIASSRPGTGLEVLGAQRGPPAIAVFALPDDPGLAQHPEMVGERRRRHLHRKRAAGSLGRRRRVRRPSSG